MELGTLDNLDEGFTFVECGGVKALYIPAQGYVGEIYKYEGNSTCGGCIITSTTKTMSMNMIPEETEEIYVVDYY